MFVKRCCPLLSGLSKWVRQLVRHYDTFTGAMQSLESFSQGQRGAVETFEETQSQAVPQYPSPSNATSPPPEIITPNKPFDPQPNALFDRLSTALVSFHQSILTGLLAQLTSPRMAVRKRSIIALGHLVPSCSPALFTQLTEHLMGELSRGPPSASVRTYIQCLATISRRGGHRIGESCFYMLEELCLPMLRECSINGVTSRGS